MCNDVGQALRDYHERTKHSLESVRRGGGPLDWGNVPAPLKRYTDLRSVELPGFRATGVSCHAAVAASAELHGERDPNLETLSHLLFHAAGVLQTVTGPAGPLYFRTYASAGALYPIEVYVVSGGLDGLETGVHHYAPAEHALTTLRSGDFRGNLGLRDEDPGAATLLLTAIPRRTAWKYGPRGFRHLYWDAGMMLANLLAAAAAQEVRARVFLGFVDEEANDLVDVDGVTEFALCGVALGRGGSPPARGVERLNLRTEPIASRPEPDPMIDGAHRALVLESEEDLAAFRSRSVSGRSAAGAVEEAPARPVDPLHAAAWSTDTLEEVVMRRGSSRRQTTESFPAAEYAAILYAALAGVPADWKSGSPTPFVVANDLDGLVAGAYRYSAGGAFESVREGDLRRKAAFVCLDQRLAADAATVTFLMADLDGALGTLGDRGYAAAQLEAAIVAGRIYLGAYAQCLGASGITFYDDEARRVFNSELEPMLAVVAGPEGGRRSIIRCRQRFREHGLPSDRRR